jgi:hypothetical protein
MAGHDHSNIAPKNPHLAEATDNQSLMQIYRNVLLRLVLDVMESIFVNNWDVTVTHFNLPSGQGTQCQPASNPPRHGIKVQRKDIAAYFPQSHGIGDADFIPSITLPPNTKVSGFSDSAQTVLKLQNSLAKVEIAIKPRGIKSGVGMTILSLCRRNFDEEYKFRTISFVISLSAEFNGLRGGGLDHRVGHPTPFSPIRMLGAED